MRRKLTLLVVVLAAAVAPAATAGAMPNWTTGGGGSGGVLDNQVLAKFDFNVDGDVLNLTQLAWWSPVNSEPEAYDDNLVCEYSGSTGDSEGLSYIDLGRSLVIRVEGIQACGTTIYAEVEVIYRDSELVTSPIVDHDCDGDLRQGVLRNSESATASVHIEMAANGLIIEAVGNTGSARYSLEQYVCIDTAPGP